MFSQSDTRLWPWRYSETSQQRFVAADGVAPARSVLTYSTPLRCIHEDEDQVSATAVPHHNTIRLNYSDVGFFYVDTFDVLYTGHLFTFGLNFFDL